MCHNSPQTGVEYQVTQLLLVDDDTALSELLVEYLGTEGFQVDAAFDGLSALQRCSDTAYDLVVLDVMLPGLTGLEVLKTLRKSSTTPVLMLTARGDDVDRIVGLEIGADDYLPKPCNPRELVARIRAILRRTQTTDAGADNSPVVVDEVELRPAERTVFVRGGTVELTSTEFNVLETLLREAGRIVTKEEVSERSLGRAWTPYDRSIDMHVSRIRRKLGAPERIKTIRGTGYLYTRAGDT